MLTCILTNLVTLAVFNRVLQCETIEAPVRAQTAVTTRLRHLLSGAVTSTHGRTCAAHIRALELGGFAIGSLTMGGRMKHLHHVRSSFA
ncbi:unnamed protein product [Mesocestoides corti]|uniref:Secreted protein n=1 Tax=Mesocestoides corti TaxID=53468 RepID=A0A0R3U765_MESCO|nr:unnamed protein product [Mesocestoides corti]